MGIVKPKEQSCVAWITLRLHDNGAMSVSGTIGDRAFARHLLAQAIDALPLSSVTEGGIVVPNRDVTAQAYPGLKPVGDIPEADRGDA